jgi:hypothetical protein
LLFRILKRENSVRYLYLALAALFALAFFTFVFPASQLVAVQFLRSNITLPIASLAGLTFILGVLAGTFATLFVLSFSVVRRQSGVRDAAVPTVGHGA